MIKSFSRLAAPALALPRALKRALALLVDICLCVLSVWLAFCLRLGEWVGITEALGWAVLVALCLAIPLFVRAGFYRAIFRYSGFPAMVCVARAMALYGALYAVVIAGIGLHDVPRTVGFIQPLLLLLFVGASRALVRSWLGGMYLSHLKRAALPQVLIYGAGDAGRQLASAMASSHEMRMVGFLDDDDRLHGHVLNGLPIYNPASLPQLLNVSPITDVLLALPSVSRQRRNAILASLAPLRVAVRTLPGMTDLATGRVNLTDVHDLDIDDLLGREPVKPDDLLLNRNTNGKTVLVTGAGGSIGSELCRQIVQCQPRQLLLVEMSEFALYQIHQELQAALQGVRSEVQGEDELSDAISVASCVEIIPLLASVCDEVRMQEIMVTWKPHTVYHAAAYKHVPLVEHNPEQGLRNNVWGTMVCALAAARNGVHNFVLISTDKAVRPTNIMGATKRLAEMVLQAMAAQDISGGTSFSMVRFGNVLGSSGSVVPLFREQIKSGGPITLTHADITRYFMTIPEAAQLVIQAGAMGAGGDVFVLDMGQPVRIYDLACRMVELSGLSLRNALNPEGDIEIAVTGLRPGEKLYEELLIGDNPQPTQHARIMKAHEDFIAWDALQEKFAVLKSAMQANSVPEIRQILQELVQGYQPTGAVVDWVHLATQGMQTAPTSMS
jgi:FlaA1/EpsC-like NDP-sugar epimerase